MKSQGDVTWRRSITAATALGLAWLLTPVPAVSQNAYITNQGVYPNFSNKVTVVDTTANKVVTTIDVGLEHAREVGTVVIASQALSMRSLLIS
jgi:DNA-binding beta-propeller fold protein YncE